MRSKQPLPHILVKSKKFISCREERVLDVRLFFLRDWITTLWLRSFRTDQRDTPKCEFWRVSPTKPFWFNTFWFSNLSFMCVATLKNNQKIKLLCVTLGPNLLCELSKR